MTNIDAEYTRDELLDLVSELEDEVARLTEREDSIVGELLDLQDAYTQLRGQHGK